MPCDPSVWRRAVVLASAVNLVPIMQDPEDGVQRWPKNATPEIYTSNMTLRSFLPPPQPFSFCLDGLAGSCGPTAYPDPRTAEPRTTRGVVLDGPDKTLRIQDRSRRANFHYSFTAVITFPFVDCCSRFSGFSAIQRFWTMPCSPFISCLAFALLYAPFLS